MGTELQTVCFYSVLFISFIFVLFTFYLAAQINEFEINPQTQCSF